MSHTLSSKRAVSLPVGVITYQVERRGRNTVGIRISEWWRTFFEKKGANLEMLDNIGSQRARNVMLRFVESIKE